MAGLGEKRLRKKDGQISPVNAFPPGVRQSKITTGIVNWPV